MARRAIQWRQLCAIARAVIETDPAIYDPEWKERTKQLAAHQGFDSVPPQMLAHALNAVEHVLEQHWGPRPPAGSRSALAVCRDTPNQDPPWRWPRKPSTGWTSLKELMASLQRSEL